MYKNMTYIRLNFFMLFYGTSPGEGGRMREGKGVRECSRKGRREEDGKGYGGRKEG